MYIKKEKGIFFIEVKERFVFKFLIVFVLSIFIFSYNIISKTKKIEEIQKTIVLETMLIWDSKNLEITEETRLLIDMDLCNYFNYQEIRGYKACRIIEKYLSE